MITVRLLGGLGNQMFQRAYGLALESRGYEVQYDRAHLVEGTHREYSLHGFVPEIRLGTSNENLVYESSMEFNPAYLEPKDGSTMVGYWQNEKYFQDIEPKVREAFQFKVGVRDANEMLGFEGIVSESVFMHVRRQDYVNLTHFHGMPAVMYYREALKLIRLYCPIVRAFIFTDDPLWCRENFPQDISVVTGHNKFEDLQYMAACRHGVVANSSYSWWAGFIGDIQRRRIVVAPQLWFAAENMKHINPARDHWHRLGNGI